MKKRKRVKTQSKRTQGYWWEKEKTNVYVLLPSLSLSFSSLFLFHTHTHTYIQNQMFLSQPILMSKSQKAIQLPYRKLVYGRLQNTLSIVFFYRFISFIMMFLLWFSGRVQCIFFPFNTFLSQYNNNSKYLIETHNTFSVISVK